MKENQPTLLCFGLGYSARVLARSLIAEGWHVIGTARGAERLSELEAMGVEAHRFDRGHPLADAAALLGRSSHLLSSVPPDEEGDPVLDAHAENIRAAGHFQWIGYLSTTGVYGDHGGAWVNEESELRPSQPRTERRVAAETLWRRLHEAHGLPVHVFRLAGIYGPGRSAIDSVRAGKARRVVKEGHLFGRIHVADIAGALRASMARPNPGAVYNVADDRPATGAEVTECACRLLNVDPPPLRRYEEIEDKLSPMARSFYSDNRRVSNTRLKEELGYELQYPDFKSGLNAIIDHYRG